MTGAVCCAHCSCMAGLGETCTHVAAVLFYIEAVARVQEQQTSIQSACHWIIPAFQKSVEYHPVQDIDFTSPAKKKKRIEDAIAITSSTELSSYEETVATPKPNTQKKTMKCPNSIHRTHVYSTLYARALYTSELCIACMHRNARHYFVRTCTLLCTRLCASTLLQ